MVAVYRMVMEVVVRSSDDGAGGPDETPKDN
jgi:hypothetical protein